MSKAKFDFMNFGYSPGDTDMFVTHASKYSPNDTVELCKREYEHYFKGFEQYGGIVKLREPTIEDVQMVSCAYRVGISSEWPDGCYTFVGDNEPGAFKVWVIDFAKLKFCEGRP